MSLRSNGPTPPSPSAWLHQGQENRPLRRLVHWNGEGVPLLSLLNCVFSLIGDSWAAWKKGLVREGAAWKNKQRVLGTYGTPGTRGGGAEVLQMTVRVACAVGKPRGLVCSPFHYLSPAQPWTNLFLLGKWGLKREREERKEMYQSPTPCPGPLLSSFPLHNSLRSGVVLSPICLFRGSFTELLGGLNEKTHGKCLGQGLEHSRSE